MKNYERMIKLVTEFFGTRTDPDQISVTDTEREHLQQIHPATMTEVANEEGPILWLLIIPTTAAIMNDFLAEKITEKQLLEQTKPGISYDAIYLCSIYVLPEFRKQGLAKKTAIDAVNQVRENQPIKALFYWPFSEEGKEAAMAISKELGLPLYERK